MKRIVTLCYQCKQYYVRAGYILIFADNPIKDECEFCFSRMGFDYVLEDEDVNKAMQ